MREIVDTQETINYCLSCELLECVDGSAKCPQVGKAWRGKNLERIRRCNHERYLKRKKKLWLSKGVAL